MPEDRLAEANERARTAETQRDALARALLFELGHRPPTDAAADEYPRDLYRQTVYVMGFDPLADRARSLTAERYDHV